MLVPIILRRGTGIHREEDHPLESFESQALAEVGIGFQGGQSLQQRPKPKVVRHPAIDEVQVRTSLPVPQSGHLPGASAEGVISGIRDAVGAG